MPRDYKSRASGQRKKKNQTPGWVWFVGGLLVGLFASGLVWLKFGAGEGMLTQRSVPPAAKPTQQAKPKPKPKPKPKKAPEPAAQKPRFDFYTILPEMEVVVPEPELQAPVVAGAAPVAKPRPDTGYMLQMGSFRKHSDADRLKASLALVGIEAEIQTVNVNGSDTFHRVRSGPYGREQVNTLRARLKENNINSLVIKLKK